MRVSTGFHAHAHGHAHAGQYGVPAQSHGQYTGLVHSGPSFARPLHMRAPVLAPAGFNHHQHTGQHQHPHPHQHQHGRSQAHDHNHNHGQNLNLAMAEPAYMASDEEMAHLQKLSNEYEPEATVSLTLT